MKKYYWARYHGTQDWAVVTEGFAPSNYVRCGDEEDIHPGTFAQVVPFAVGPPRVLLTDAERAVLPPPSPGSTWVWNLVTKTWDVVKEA